MTAGHLTPPDYAQLQEYLPESVTQIAELIGWEATGRLINHFGGVDFPVGKGLRGSGARRLSLLREALTPEQIDLLVSTFGGERLFIPQCKQAKTVWRNRLFIGEVQRLTDNGESVNMALTVCCPRFGIGATRARELWREQVRRGAGDE